MRLQQQAGALTVVEGRLAVALRSDSGVCPSNRAGRQSASRSHGSPPWPVAPTLVDAQQHHRLAASTDRVRTRATFPRGRGVQPLRRRTHRDHVTGVADAADQRRVRDRRRRCLCRLPAHLTVVRVEVTPTRILGLEALKCGKEGRIFKARRPNCNREVHAHTNQANAAHRPCGFGAAPHGPVMRAPGVWHAGGAGASLPLDRDAAGRDSGAAAGAGALGVWRARPACSMVYVSGLYPDSQ